MEIGRVLAWTDYLRRSPARAGGLSGHKEWLHFCLHHRGVDVLVNFSVADDVDKDRPKPFGERAHVIVLVGRGGEWLGDVDRFFDADVDIAGGEVSARIGESRVDLRRGVFYVKACLREVPVEVNLTLTPETFPSFSNNIRLRGDHGLSWLAVPRLRASGSVRTPTWTANLDGAIAYHDHNWGHFAWGADFAWEWGYGAPSDTACPWSFMFVRLGDRAMTTTRTTALTLWRGSEIARSFRGRDLRFETEGFLAMERVFKVPPVMALLSPGTATEVPRRLSIEAESDGDELEIELTSHDVAQIIVPNDRGLGVTIVNEVAASLRARGRVGGQPVSYEGRGMFEVLTS